MTARFERHVGGRPRRATSLAEPNRARAFDLGHEAARRTRDCPASRSHPPVTHVTHPTIEIRLDATETAMASSTDRVASPVSSAVRGG